MERIGSLVVAPSTERKAEPNRFGAALRNAAGEVANGVAGSVALAAPYLPGGAVLAGALRSAAPAASSAAKSNVASAAGASGSVTSAAVTAGGSSGDIVEATRVLQQEAQTSNLQFLQLQESMQRESREFTSLTNVMKVKHDSAKAAINNIH